MKKRIIVSALCLSLSSVNAMNSYSIDGMVLCIDDTKRNIYKEELIALRESIDVGHDEYTVMRNWCKEQINAVIEILGKDEGIVLEEYKKVCSIITNFLPELEPDKKPLLRKVLVFSLFQELTKNAYDFIGSSFYPNLEDLESIKFDNEILKPWEFLQIQSVLEESLSDGVEEEEKVKEAFKKALGSIKECRNQMATAD